MISSHKNHGGTVLPTINCKDLHSERLKDIDIIKGYCIVLMVMGHCRAPFKNWIYLFHMPVFFMVSGYCWKDKNVCNLKSYKNYIIKKIKRLYIPYICCNSVYILLNNFFIHINIYTDNPLFLELVQNGKISPRLDALQTFHEIIKVICFFGNSQLGGATWFLWCLFTINILYGAMVLICNLTGIQSIQNKIATVLFFILLMESSLINNRLLYFNPAIINALPACFMAFLIGIFLKHYDSILKYNVFFCMISFISLYLLSLYGTLEISQGIIINPLFYIFASLSGWILLRSFAVLQSKKQKIFQYLGNNTMPILLLHFLSFKIISFIYLFITNQPLLLLASFPVLNNIPDYLWICYTFTAIIVPITIEKILYCFFDLASKYALYIMRKKYE